MRILEGKAAVAPRRTFSSLVALLDAGKLSVKDLSDQELEQIIAGATGDDADLRHLSDDELTAIINGGGNESN